MSQAQPLSVHELEQAFEVFNRVSVELDTSYRELESKVEGLSTELAAARSARLRELAEKERLAHRLSSLVAALPGGVLILDPQQIIRDANPEAVQCLGEPLIGQAWTDVLQRVSGCAQLRSQEMLLKGGGRFSVVTRRLEKLGEHVVLITDISEIHQLQEQLSREKRLTALGEMAARLAHQIRTPLSSTTLYLAQLGRADLAVDQREAIAGRVAARLVHMGKLVDSMLSFVRGEVPATEVVYLNRVLSEFGLAMAPHLNKSGASLAIPQVDDTLQIMGDQAELVGALSNLAMNALEAADGPVSLDLWVGALDHERLQIRVRDNGPGIEQDILDRIFDPFFTTRAEGTGLGLAVVARTVSNHGGEITAHNRPEGGAEFVISLPMGSAAAAGSSATTKQQQEVVVYD